MTTERPQKSTTVRMHSRPILRAVRGGFALAERWAPTLGARAAARLWCRVPRGRRIVPTAPTIPGRRTVVRAAGRQVAVESWGNGASVYLVHAWGSSRQQWAPFVRPLVEAGLRVVALDAPSHGDSAPGASGRRHGTLQQFVDALAATVAVFGPARAIVGHSLGGAAAAVAVLDGVPTDRLVLVSSPVDPLSYTPEFAAVLGFGERVRMRLLHRLEVLSGRPVTAFDVAARARGGAERHLPPLLAVHDIEDKEARYDDALRIVEAWPQAELVTTRGLGHRRIMRDDEVVRLVVDHVAGQDERAPAGPPDGSRRAGRRES